MFVWNIKLNFKKLLFICIIIAVVIAVFIELNNMESLDVENKEIKAEKYDYVLSDSHFATILKSIHDNINKNVGKTIKMSGFVFRMPDFKDNNFVCGRNMIVAGEDKVVGFLCDYKLAKDFKDDEWVEITGTIVLGTYIDSVPVIKIKEIKKIPPLSNTYVTAPVTN